MDGTTTRATTKTTKARPNGKEIQIPNQDIKEAKKRATRTELKAYTALGAAAEARAKEKEHSEAVAICAVRSGSESKPSGM